VLVHAHLRLVVREPRQVEPRRKGRLVDGRDDPIDLRLVELAELPGCRPRAPHDLVRVLQNRGIGTELVRDLVQIARKQGLIGLTAEVLKENEPMLRVFEKLGLPIEKTAVEESYDLRIDFTAEGRR
jgi:GNAT superfamily N-acetyltransferase